MRKVQDITFFTYFQGRKVKIKACVFPFRLLYNAHCRLAFEHPKEKSEMSLVLSPHSYTSIFRSGPEHLFNWTLMDFYFVSWRLEKCMSDIYDHLKTTCAGSVILYLLWKVLCVDNCWTHTHILMHTHTHSPSKRHLCLPLNCKTCQWNLHWRCEMRNLTWGCFHWNFSCH